MCSCTPVTICWHNCHWLERVAIGRPHNVKFELLVRLNVRENLGLRPLGRKTSFLRNMSSTIVQLTRYSPSFKCAVQKVHLRFWRCVISCLRGIGRLELERVVC